MTDDRLVSQLAREATLAQRVEQELQRLILESRLGAGDRLPSERELASQFGVSRTVVREAVRALAAKQLVDVNVGRGTVVRAPSAESAAESMKLLLLMQAGGAGVEKVSEVRHIVENEIAALAASRRTDDDLHSLTAILDETRQHLDAPEVYIKSDVEFHAALARATQNELFVVVLDSLVEVMIEVRLLTLRVPGITSLALSFHERILDAVEAGDPGAARAAMDAHMDQAADILRQAVVSDPGVSVLALDIGSSRIKALLAGWDGRLIEVRSASTPRQSIEAGEVSYPVEAVFSSLGSLVAGLAAAHTHDRPDTIVFSCLGTAMAPLDREGRPLGAALAPADTRPSRGPGLDETIDMDAAELVRRTGSDPGVASFLGHALWWQREHPEVDRRIARFRSLRGYAMQELCSADVEDRTWATRTMLVDLETNDWSGAILSAAGLPADVWPALEPPTSTFPVRQAVIERLGLAPAAVAVLGAMDNVCSLFGADGPDRSGLVNIVGTYEHMAGAASLSEVRAVAGMADAVVHSYVLPDRYIAMTRQPMGELLGRVATGDRRGLDGLMRDISDRPQGDRLALDAGAVDEALAAGWSRAAVLQALVESGAAVLARFADAWARLGRPTSPISAVGGGAARETTLQLKADLLGRSFVTLQSDQGAGLGALRLAAMARRAMSASEACALFANPITRTIPPRPSAPMT